MPRAITCDVIITSASTRADGSLSLKLATPELDAPSKTVFFELLNQNLKMLLQPTGSEMVEMKEVKSQFDRKTHSQRLRGTMFLVWKQADGTGDFEDFYRRNMESIIEQWKQRLEPKDT